MMKRAIGAALATAAFVVSTQAFRNPNPPPGGSSPNTTPPRESPPRFANPCVRNGWKADITILPMGPVLNGLWDSFDQSLVCIG